MATVDEIDDMRRQGRISWEEYAQLLKGNGNPRLMVEYRPAPNGRDRSGRLRELENLTARGDD